MRVLETNEVRAVAGGIMPTVQEVATTGGFIGGGVGASVALSSGGGLAGIAATYGPTVAIGTGAAAGTGVAAAGYGGWMVGTAISNALPDSANESIGAGIASLISAAGSMLERGAMDLIGLISPNGAMSEFSSGAFPGGGGISKYACFAMDSD